MPRPPKSLSLRGFPLAHTPAEPENGTVVPLEPRRRGPPRVGRLDAPEHWEREIGRLYRKMTRGEIDSTEAARRAYVAECGLRATRAKLETRKAEAELQLARELQAAMLALERPGAGEPQVPTQAQDLAQDLEPAEPRPDWADPRPGDEDYQDPETGA